MPHSSDNRKYSTFIFLANIVMQDAGECLSCSITCVHELQDSVRSFGLRLRCYHISSIAIMHCGQAVTSDAPVAHEYI